MEGWQGGLEGAGKAWSVPAPELGKGPFRWALTRRQAGALLTSSDLFHLPSPARETVERSVTVLTLTLTPTVTAQPAASPAGEPIAGPGGPAAATARPSATPTPTATSAPADGTPQPTISGLVPVVQAEPAPQGRARPCASPLVGIAAGVLAMLLVGIAGGWLWQRRRQQG